MLRHEGVQVIQRISTTLIHSIQPVTYTEVVVKLLHTAKRSLACAKKWEQSTKVSLECALQQLKEAEKNAKDAKDQVRDAELHLRSVEKVCLKTHYV